MLSVRPHPFSVESHHLGAIPEGQSIQTIIDGIDVHPDIKQLLVVQLDGRIIHRRAWGYTIPHRHVHMTVVASPRGGGGDNSKGILGTVAMIALTFAAGPIAGAFFKAGSVAFNVARVGITLIGALLIGALFKPPTIEDEKTGDSYTLSGQSNRVRPGEGLMRIYGSQKVFPDVAALPYTMAVGGEEDLYVIYSFGYGPIDVTDLRIGNTPIDNYDHVEYRIQKEWVTGTQLYLYPDDVDLQEFSITLECDDEGGVPTTEEMQEIETTDSCDTAVVEFAFPQGLMETDGDGDKNPRSTLLGVEYRVNGDSTWLPFSNLDYSFSANESDGYGPRVSSTGEDYVYWDNPTKTVFIGTSTADDIITYRYARYVKSGDTTLPVKLTSSISSGDKITLHGTIYTVQSDYGVGNRNVSISPALKQDVRIGTYTQEQTDPVTTQFYADVIVNVWETGSEVIFVRYKTQVPFTLGLTIYFPARDKYDLRLSRQRWWDAEDAEKRDMTVLRSLKSITNEPPIDTDVPITIMELKIRASRQLNGTVDTLSAFCEAEIPVYTGGSWVTQATSNPAWIYRDILTGSASKKPATDARIDDDRLLEWATHCDQESPTDPQENYLSCDFVSTGSTTTLALLQKVAACGRATPTMRDNKYSVVYDELDKEPIQVFTQRNSWGFEMRREFIEQPDGLRVSFIDKDEDYQPGERIVYDDGYGRYDQELNPDPDLLNAGSVWSVQTGWTVGSGYAECGGTQTTTTAATITADDTVYTGVFYAVTFTLSDYSDGILTIKVGSGESAEVTANGSYSLYVSAHGAVQTIALVGDADFVGKISDLSIASTAASTIENLDLFGCVSPDLAWRMGRYALATGQLRPTEFSFYADIENLVCERGDRILLAYDSIASGGTVARIMAIDERTITTDEAIYTVDGIEYACTIRMSTGEVVTTGADHGSGTHDILLDVAHIDMSVGDLIIFGVKDEITNDLIISSISPSNDLTAHIKAVPYAEEIHDADTGYIPDYTPLINSYPSTVQPESVKNLDGTAIVSYITGVITVDFTLTWDVGDTSNLDVFQAWWISNETGEWVLLEDNVKGTSVTVRPVTDQSDIASDIIDQTNTFSIVAVNFNKQGYPPSVSPQVGIYVGDPALNPLPPPSPDTDLLIDAQSDQAVIQWVPPANMDNVSHYELRYRPDNVGGLWLDICSNPYFRTDLNETWDLSEDSAFSIVDEMLYVDGTQTSTITAWLDTVDDGTNKSYRVEWTNVEVTAGTSGVAVNTETATLSGATGLHTDTVTLTDSATTIQIGVEVDSSFQGFITGIKVQRVMTSYPTGSTYVVWENASTLVDSIARDATSISVPFRRGSYFLRTVSYAGMYCEDDAYVQTTSDIETDTIVADEVVGWPWTGDKDRVSISNETLALDTGELVGYYYFDREVTLPDIFRVNATAKIGTYRSATVNGQFAKITTEISYGTNIIYVSDWGNLDTVTVLADTASEYSSWAQFYRGDYHGEAFRFRLKFERSDATYPLAATDAKVKLSVYKNVQSGQGLTNTAGTQKIYFPSEYYAAPNVSATLGGSGTTTQYIVDIVSVSTDHFIAIAFSVVASTGVKTATAATIDWTATGYGRVLSISEVT